LKDYEVAYGGELFITPSGFGLGGYWQKLFSEHSALDISLSISGLKNSDETRKRVYDPETGQVEYVYKNKINRLYRMPVTVSYKLNIFTETLGAGFRPYILGGVGGTVIWQVPYQDFEYEFFDAINYSEFFIKPTVVAGLGLDFGILSNKRMSVFFNYQYTPAGDSKIISIEELPIDNCGGFFLGIRFGGAK
jgi:hypothetical protein